MALSTSHQIGVKEVPKDSNNNCDRPTRSYGLRPRLTQRAAEDDEPLEGRVLRTRGRTKRRENHHPLSRYRRKTANARERSRMREINEAFETLRRAIPQVPDPQAEKTTKISTLRLAMDYISALHRVLQSPRELDILSSVAGGWNKSSVVPGVNHRSSPLLPGPSSPLPVHQTALTLAPEADDQSFSSTSDIPDLFLVSLDFDASKASLPTVTSDLVYTERTNSQRMCDFSFQEDSFVFDDELFLTNSR